MAERPPWAGKKSSSRSSTKRKRRGGERPPWAGGGSTEIEAGPGSGFVRIPEPERPKKKGKSIWGHLADPFVNTGHALAGIPGGLIHQGAAIGKDIGRAGVDVYHHPLHAVTRNPVISGAWLAKELAQHPEIFTRSHTYKDVIKPVGLSYAHKYGDPFARRGFSPGAFQLLATRMFVDDPLGTAADIFTAATLGTGAGVKLGLMDALTPAQRTIVLRAAGRGEIRKGLAGRTEFGARARLKTDKALKRLPERTPVLGEQARYGRAVIASQLRELMRHTNKVIPYFAARRKLSEGQLIAADVMHDFPTQKALDQHMKDLAETETGQHTLKLLERPDVKKAFAEGTNNPKVKRFLEEAAKLGEHSSLVAGLAEDTILQRRFLPLLLQRGFRMEFEPFKHVDPKTGGWSDEVSMGKSAHTDEHGVGRIVGYDPETDMVQFEVGRSKKVKKEEAIENYRARAAGKDVNPPPSFTYRKEVPFSSLRDPKKYKLYGPDGHIGPVPPEPVPPPEPVWRGREAEPDTPVTKEEAAQRRAEAEASREGALSAASLSRKRSRARTDLAKARMAVSRARSPATKEAALKRVKVLEDRVAEYDRQFTARKAVEEPDVEPTAEPTVDPHEAESFGEFMARMNDPEQNPQIAKPPEKIAPHEVPDDHPELELIQNARRRVNDLDAEGMADEYYKGVLSMLGRTIKWEEYPSARAAVIDRLDTVEAQIRKRVAKETNEARDPVNILKKEKVAAESELERVRKQQPKQGRTEEERAQMAVELEARQEVIHQIDEAIHEAENPPIQPVEPPPVNRAQVIEENRIAAVRAEIEKIREELAAEGRPEPLYREHTSVADDVNPAPYAGGGVSPTGKKVVHQSRGTLLEQGRVLYGQDTLGPVYMRVVRRALADARHKELLKAGVPIDAGTSLAEVNRATKQKWRYVRQTEGDRPSYLEQTDAEFADALEQMDAYKKGDGQWNDMADELTTEDPSKAYELPAEEADGLEAPGGIRVIVPEKMVKQIAGEFQKNTRAAAKVLKTVTNTWRALVLNLRLGWLVNNVVGNTGLYFLQNTGPGALRELIGSKHGSLTAEDIGEHVPEQIASAYGTQMPRRGRIGTYMERKPVLKQIQQGPEILRRGDIAWEQRLRRATVNRALNASPELKSLAGDMRNQTKSIRELKIKALKDNPELVDRVSGEAYRTLGNFNNLSWGEQNIVRQAIPFYAWYRAITKVALQLPIDNPIRTAILNQAGQEGYKRRDVFGDPEIAGAMRLPGGFTYRLGGYNPFSTLPQVGGAGTVIARSLLAGIPKSGIKAPSPRELSFAVGIGNPVMTAPVTGGYWRTFRYLPETRMFWPIPTSATYADPGYRAELLQWAGFPIRRPIRPEDLLQQQEPIYVPGS